MNEDQWLASVDLSAMFEFAQSHASERQVRLFFCAASRVLWQHMIFEESRHAVETAEKYADGLATEMELFFSNYAAEMPTSEHRPLMRKSAAEMAHFASGLRHNSQNEFHLIHILRVHMSDVPQHGRGLLRDILGNPFRPITFSPEWRTDTAIALARQMYDSREFSAMPILADALQDAGCDNNDILNHCRDAKQVHVRGCWVVDLILEKE